MHLRSRNDAQILRGASTGPHALMMRRALQPFVPDRGAGLGYVYPLRRRTFAGLGASTLLQEGKTGISAGSTAATISTTIGSGIASAVGAGAAAGSFVPVIGTAIGVIVGLVASGVFSHRVDPEVGNFNNAMALYAQNPQAIYNIADKYLVLAGLFDLEPGQIKGNIPIYKKYGRMGEQRFTQDMVNLIYNAAQAGQITGNDTPESVFARIVQPWINDFGFGVMQDRNADMINEILVGMIAEYVTGLWRNRWFARSGDMPNWQIPTFGLPSAATPAAVAPTASATPSPVATAAAAPAIPSEIANYQAGRLPNVGDAIHYAYNGNAYVALPGAMVFMGVGPGGAWILRDTNRQTYLLQGTSLNPYAVPTQAAPAPAAKVSLPPGMTADVSAPLPVSTGTTSPVTTPAPVPVGGGGYYTSPLSSPAAATPATVSTTVAGIPLEALAIGGGVLLLIVLLKRRRA